MAQTNWTNADMTAVHPEGGGLKAWLERKALVTT